MKEFIDRLFYQFQKGKNCKSCCLTCENYYICSMDVASEKSAQEAGRGATERIKQLLANFGK